MGGSCEFFMLTEQEYFLLEFIYTLDEGYITDPIPKLMFG